MSRRVLIDLRHDKDGTLSQLRSRRVRVVTQYPKFALVEATSRQIQQLRDRKITIIPLGERTVKVGGVRVDEHALNDLPETLRATPKAADEPGYFVVALIGPFQPEWKRALTLAGADTVAALPNYGFVIKGSSAAAESVKALEFVAWLAPYHPGLKLGANLFRHPARHLRPADIRPEAIGADALPYGEVEVTFFKGEDPATAIAAVERLGGVVTHRSRTQLRVRVAPDAVARLAAIEGVKRIDRHMPDEYDNDLSAGILQVADVRASHELDGEGQIVAVMDTGLDTGVDDATMHVDFQGRIEALVPLTGRADAIDGEAHGTHVCGTVLGNGTASGGVYAGVAPEARIVMLAKPDSMASSDDMVDAFEEAHSRDARIQNNSWGKNSDSSYEAYAEAIDQYVWDHRDFLPMFSAGNSGRDSEPDGVANLDSLRSTGAAKNCLCVGGSENNRPSGSSPTPGRDTTYGDYYTSEALIDPIASDHFSDNPQGIFYHSSRGPSDDGRIKPDVIAPATNVLSTRSSAAGDPPPEGEEMDGADPLNPTYLWMTGTSMSTPLVTGSVALARQYLIQQRGHERTDDHPRPSAALLKALIINGATDITGQYAPSEAGTMPNPNEGWGRVNINTSLFPAATGQAQFSDFPEYALQTGEERTFHVHVSDNSQPLKVTLVWTDAPGAGVINELYLRVEDPLGTTYDGDYNDDGTLNPYADVGVNGVQNNVQQVIIPTPELGQHAIQVIALSVSVGLDPSPRADLASDVPVQDFALVVSNGTGYSKQPVSLMQVIDRSGSMGYYGYIEPAKLRAKEIVDVLQINDKTGVVSFNEAASLDHDLIPISSYDDKEDVKGTIDPLSSGGTTSIGAGVALAQAQFTEDGLPHAIVVLSDGFSNTPPYEIDPPDGSAPVVDAAFVATGTVIYTIALGETADTDRLEALAAATSGSFYQVLGYSDLHKLHEIYYNIQALASGDAIVELDSDEAGPGETKEHSAELDDSSTEAFFGVSSDEDDDNLQLVLIDPRGRLIRPDTRKAIYREGDGYRFYRVTLPVPGTWRLRVTNVQKRSTEQEGKTRYTVVVLSDSSIDMEVRIVGKPLVGEDLSLNVQLRQNGRPISTAVVRAQIVRLSASIDELLKRYAGDLDQIKLDEKATVGDDPARARLAVLDRLLTEQGKSPVFTTRTEEISLRAAIQAGVYASSLPRSIAPEVYTIRVAARGVVGRDPQTTFTRKATVGVNIAPAAQPEMDFEIKDIFLVPQTVRKPGTIRFQPMTKDRNVIGMIVMDADGTPSTPREGTAVAVTIVFPDGKRLALEDVSYSKHLGAYLVTVAGAKGVVEVTAKATRGNASRTRTERLKLR
ncbi:MAG: S8 family serine peptidase [Chloroflexi bacterium]|nr:S8 family serine peptidase [Chloroflexota bacterium]